MLVPCSIRKDKADSEAIMGRSYLGMIADACVDRRILITSDVIVKSAGPKA